VTADQQGHLDSFLHGTPQRFAAGCHCHRCSAGGPILDPHGIVTGKPLGVKSYAAVSWDARILFGVVPAELITAKFGPAAAASMASNGAPDFVVDMLCVTIAGLHPIEVYSDYHVPVDECTMHPERFGPYLPWSARTIRAMVARPDWVPPAACGLLRQDDTLVDEVLRLVRLGFSPRSTRALQLLATRLSPAEIVAIRVESMNVSDEDEDDDVEAEVEVELSETEISDILHSYPDEYGSRNQ